MTYLYSTLNLFLYTHTVPITYHAIQKLKAELVHPIVCHNHLKFSVNDMLSLIFQETHTHKNPLLRSISQMKLLQLLISIFLKNQYKGKGLTSKVNSSNDYFWCGKVKGLYRKLCLILTEKCFL